MRSSQPLRKASKADVPLSSVGVYQEFGHDGWKGKRSSLTPRLDAEMHFRLGRMRDGVAAKLDTGAGFEQIRRVLLLESRRQRGSINLLFHDEEAQCIA